MGRNHLAGTEGDAANAALAAAAWVISSDASRARRRRPRHQAASELERRSNLPARSIRAPMATRVAEAPATLQSSVAAATAAASRRNTPGLAGDFAAKRSTPNNAAGPALAFASCTTATAQASKSSEAAASCRESAARRPTARTGRCRAIHASSSSALAGGLEGRWAGGTLTGTQQWPPSVPRARHDRR